MLVYRYEGKDGDGPYSRERYKQTGERLCDSHAGCRHHPTIGRDTNYRNREEHYCACETLKGLKHWFSGFNRDLKKAGLSVVAYEVNPSYVLMGESKRQVAFVRDQARVVSVDGIPITF